MSRNLKYLLAYLAVTTLLTLGGLALKPEDSPAWQSEDDPPLEDAEANHEFASHAYATVRADVP